MRVPEAFEFLFNATSQYSTSISFHVHFFSIMIIIPIMKNAEIN